MSPAAMPILLLAGVFAALPAPVVAQQVTESASIVSQDVSSQISMFSFKEGPESELDLRGTPLAPNGKGKVEVEYQKGNARIDAEVDDLPAPSSLGPYTTYVLWALTPDGRGLNQGVFDDSARGKGKLETTYPASQFALIVTAEPHFAVSVPSKMVVLYNVADQVKGTETKVTAIRERADYAGLASIPVSKSMPVELAQAKYALAIAGAAGGAQYAANKYQAAQAKLAAAEAAYSSKKSAERKSGPALAREAVVAGEDARRAGMAGKVAAEQEAQRAAAATAAAAAAAAAERESAEKAAAVAAKNDLQNRLNAALPTRATERGLVSEIGGVQFATGTANLNARAKESLAKFAGVVASYPALRFNVEGHTDNTGSEAVNKELSLKRAIAVRDYLIGQGTKASSIDVAGLGSAMPIGENSTADGRARNRRVEIVVSGGPLGSK